MASSLADPLDRIRSLAERVAHDYGLEIFDVQFRRESIGWVLRVVIDRPSIGGSAPVAGGGSEDSTGGSEDSIGIEECRRVSQDLSALLDVEEGPSVGEALAHRYTLEVSSPGLDRPLRDAGDYQRFAGRLAKIVVTEAIDGQMHFEGRLQGVEKGMVLLTQGRRVRRIPLGSISRGRLEVEF